VAFSWQGGELIEKRRKKKKKSQKNTREKPGRNPGETGGIRENAGTRSRTFFFFPEGELKRRRSSEKIIQKVKLHLPP